jgi:BirA family biotin operon repressor/biotin-[acetyl-CoA-carboxylase] ligase
MTRSHGKSDTFNVKNLEADLPTKLVGRTVLIYDEVDSTNDSLKPILADAKYNGLAVFARFQRRGKGREGRTWKARPDSSVLVSVLIQLEGKTGDHFGAVSLASAIAAAQAVIQTFQLPARIKWPNDIYLSGKKLTGILIESASAGKGLIGFVIGIGTNLAQQTKDFPPELRDLAISISQAIGRPVEEFERLKFARELLVQLDHHIEKVQQRDYATLRQEWLALAGGPDHPVIVTRQNQTFHARIIDIDHRDNSLLVQVPGGLIVHLKQNTCKVI